MSDTKKPNQDARASSTEPLAFPDLARCRVKRAFGEYFDCLNLFAPSCPYAVSFAVHGAVRFTVDRHAAKLASLIDPAKLATLRERGVNPPLPGSRAELRSIISEAFAGSNEVFVDGCEMIFQRRVKILFHPVEHLGFLRLKLRDGDLQLSDNGRFILALAQQSKTSTENAQ
jgi:hypothetical protein